MCTDGSDDLPLFSIITVVFNGERFIQNCIQSVLAQTFTLYEYIVIDGGSTDKTVEIIKSYEKQLSYWVSEPDSGIYHAMNKGLNRVNGRWIFFLGADDRFFDNEVLSRISGILKDELDIVFGNIKYNSGDIVISKFSVKTLLHNTIHHQSAFYSRRNFLKWRYDQKFRLISDYELNLKIYKKKGGYRYIDTCIAICDQSGMSRSLLDIAFKETNEIRRRYHGVVQSWLLKVVYYIKFKIKNV